MRIPIEQIKPSQFATRPTPLEVKSLAESIENFGQLQPIKVRPVDGGYECVFGTRRLLATQKAGFDEVEGIVQDLDDRQARLQIWEENEEREDLDDVARGRFLKLYSEDYGVSFRQMVPIFGLHWSLIGRLVALVDEPEPIRRAVESRLSTTEAVTKTRQILGRDDPARVNLFEQIAEERSSTPELIARARAIKYQQRRGRFTKKDEDWQQLPSVKALVSHIQELREWMRLGRAMVIEEKLAPEAKRFLANKLMHLIRALSEWREELEDG